MQVLKNLSVQKKVDSVLDRSEHTIREASKNFTGSPWMLLQAIYQQSIAQLNYSKNSAKSAKRKSLKVSYTDIHTLINAHPSLEYGDLQTLERFKFITRTSHPSYGTCYVPTLKSQFLLERKKSQS